MTYKNLRAFMKRISPPEDHILKNCDIVIDGRSFFNGTYKASGCKSILGGEYDRYADYLRNLLKPFKESNVTCHVIFNGGMEADIERRKEIHQNVIDNANSIDPTDNDAYCEPIFVKDVWREVLDELKIQYYVTEHDSWKAIFFVADNFRCPILTRNYEYSLVYKDCISPKSLVFHEGSKEIACKIFYSNTVRGAFRVKHDLLPLFLTLLDESSVYFKQLSDIVDCLRPKDIFPKVLRWTRWQADGLDKTFEKIQASLTEEEVQKFFDAYQRNEELCRRTKHWPAVKHFQQNKKNGNDKMPVPYANLICNGTFSGSWVVFDKDQEDAMLPAMDIIFYACECFKFLKDIEILFIGRKDEVSQVWELSKSCDKVSVRNPDLFKNFVYDTMPGFDFEHLKTVPEECWILIVTLVYYSKKRIDYALAYSMILSYVMLGPVTDSVGLIKRSNFISPDVPEKVDLDQNGLLTNDCILVVDSLMDLFYVEVKKLNRHYDRKILHTFAEFQHCLQHMNNLNNLCGKKIKNTIYYKTLNVTFAYNVYIKMQRANDYVKYLEKRMKKTTVFDCFMRIEKVFKASLQSVGLES